VFSRHGKDWTDKVALASVGQILAEYPIAQS
jgi:hypothetical protein